MTSSPSIEDAKHQTSELPIRKLLPRNLTAKANYLVPGNPMIARPESGVGNAHPGLEFDVRALDRHFFPGLVFDFQFGLGAKLVAFKQAIPGFMDSDLKADVFLLFLHARFGSIPGEPQTVDLGGQDGYLVLRRIIDLEASDCTIIIGPLPRSKAQREELCELACAFPNPAEPRIKRDANQRLDYAILSGTRTKYLSQDGVIGPDLIAPGELTQNLCSPWQWDFADCYCYYWASSKPDIVVGLNGEAQVLNFQRDRSAREPEKPPSTPTEWMANNVDGADMIVDWEKLPIVTSNREGVVPRVPKWPKLDSLMSLSDIREELRRLAELEHALCVEYLFARYSLRADQTAPNRFHRGARVRYRAAGEVLSIAKDEMRHLRWVNEMLQLLGEKPCVNRATDIGKNLPRKFQLRPLNLDVLDEFIAIEAPASTFNDDPRQLDSAYSHLLVSLHALPGQGDLIRRFEQLTKAIIDEGGNHWERFRRVKKHLAGRSPNSFLRWVTAPEAPQKEPWKSISELCDSYYELLLYLLTFTFFLGRYERGTWIKVSRLAMYALDNCAYALTAKGLAPRFKLPDWAKTSTPFFSSPYRPEQNFHNVRDLLMIEEIRTKILGPVYSCIDKVLKTGSSSAHRFAQKAKADMDKLEKTIVKAYNGET